MELKLKRGSGLAFDGENWKLAGDSKWEKQPLYVANGYEEFMGLRVLHGQEHAIFRCLNDTFFAQPTDICKLPVPSDPMEVLYDAYERGEEEVSSQSKKSTPITKALVFKGANWKLVKDSKWKPMTGFLPSELENPVGTKTIGSKSYNIYKSSMGFIAISEG